MSPLVSALFLALLAQAPSTAPAPPVSATAAATATANTGAKIAKPGDAVVCQRVDDTGTRFSHQVCHTKDQWAQITADAKSSTEDFQRASSLTAPH